jgi:hypothetical protein
VIARRLGPAQLQSIERRLARRWRAALPSRRKLAHQNRHHRVVPQPVVIDEVLVAQRHTEHALSDQRPDLMFHQIRSTAIPEAGREPVHQPDRPIGCAQQHTTGIRTDRPAVESRLDAASFQRSKSKQISATLCRHRG